jgi:hypothetical protein
MARRVAGNAHWPQEIGQETQHIQRCKRECLGRFFFSRPLQAASETNSNLRPGGSLLNLFIAFIQRLSAGFWSTSAP